MRKFSRSVVNKGISLGLTGLVAITGMLSASMQDTQAATFTTFSVRPSRVETSQAGVNFLVKLSPVTTATETSVDVTFGEAGSYTLGAAGTITTSTAGLTSWDSSCTVAVPSLGATAASVTGQTANFVVGDMTVGNTYCFIISGGVTNPAAAGNNAVMVETLTAASAVIDSGALSLPTITDDEVVITAAVAPFVRCDVTTTVGADNASDLGTLVYGMVSTSSDDIQVRGGTNAVGGMEWYYRVSGANNGLYSTLTSALLNGATAESTLNPTTLNCSGATPCFGIYHNGTKSTATGEFLIAPGFEGGSAVTSVGPMTNSIYGTQIGYSDENAVSQGIANFNINATAAETSPVATDYSATLIFTCKAGL
jgi:hypothetical protein